MLRALGLELELEGDGAAEQVGAERCSLSGFQPAKITRATATKPRPTVIPRTS